MVVINPQSGMVINRYKTGRRPYRILFHPDGKSFFVTHWADGSMGHYDTATGSAAGDVRIGPHPTDMVWRARGRSSLRRASPYARAPVRGGSEHEQRVRGGRHARPKNCGVIESINMAMTPRQPLGMTPSGLAIRPTASGCTSRARTATWPPWWTSRRSAAGSRASSRRAGIRPRCASCPSGAWSC